MLFRPSVDTGSGYTTSVSPALFSYFSRLVRLNTSGKKGEVLLGKPLSFSTEGTRFRGACPANATENLVVR